MRKVLRIQCPKKFHFWAKTVSVWGCQPWRAAAQNRKPAVSLRRLRIPDPRIAHIDGVASAACSILIETATFA
jgi:hypothetical protein